MLNTLDCEIGDAVFLDQQEYRLTAVKPVAKKDGSTTEVLFWGTDCPSCGAAFEASTPRAASTSPTRRCPPCRRPGKPIVGKRGRRVVVTR